MITALFLTLVYVTDEDFFFTPALRISDTIRSPRNPTLPFQLPDYSGGIYSLSHTTTNPNSPLAEINIIQT